MWIEHDRVAVSFEMAGARRLKCCSVPSVASLLLGAPYYYSKMKSSSKIFDPKNSENLLSTYLSTEIARNETIGIPIPRVPVILIVGSRGRDGVFRSNAPRKTPIGVPVVA